MSRAGSDTSIPAAGKGVVSGPKSCKLPQPDAGMLTPPGFSDDWTNSVRTV